MTKTLRLALILAPLALVAGCADKFKEPAEAAVKAAEGAVEALKSDEVTQYAGGPAKAVTDALAVAKAKLTAKEFEAALAAAKDLPARVKDVVGQASQAAQAAAEAKKQAVAAAWQEASKEASGALSAANEKLTALKKVKVLPKGFDRKKLAAAAARVAAVESDWAKAAEKAKAGAVEEATALAKDLAARGKELVSSLPGVKATAAKPVKAPAKKR
jgi:PBP1b-binding outer membrane lipoprotein LpoB